MTATLVALDIDGTLLDHDEHLSDRVRKAVQSVSGNGTRVVLATGRSIHGTLPVTERLGLVRGWVICSNGAVTVRLDPDRPEGHEITDVVTFDPGPALAVLREYLPTALIAVEVVGHGHLLTAPFPDGELSGPHRVVPFEELRGIRTTRVVVRSIDHSPQEFLEVVRRTGLHDVNYAVGWTAWLDLAPVGVSKASALERVRQRLGVRPEDTIAIGDGRNDLEMLAWAGRGIAMGQATEDVIAAADEVTATVTEDGVALVLEALPTLQP